MFKPSCIIYMYDAEFSLGTTTQFGQVQRLSVKAEQNDFGNLIYSDPIVSDEDAGYRKAS
jgi:hypothetical protein